MNTNRGAPMAESLCTIIRACEAWKPPAGFERIVSLAIDARRAYVTIVNADDEYTVTIDWKNGAELARKALIIDEILAALAHQAEPGAIDFSRN